MSVKNLVQCIGLSKHSMGGSYLFFSLKCAPNYSKVTEAIYEWLRNLFMRLKTI